MNPWRRKLRLATVAAVAVMAAACSPSSIPRSSSGGTPAKGGTVSVALPAGDSYSWIFPFYGISNASPSTVQFQWLMYRPLYFFGDNTYTDVSINYPLSPAKTPVYSNGAKTVTVTMKGWKWSNGEKVDADSVLFFLHMAMAEKSDWFALHAQPAAGQHCVRHGQG